MHLPVENPFSRCGPFPRYLSFRGDDPVDNSSTGPIMNATNGYIQQSLLTAVGCFMEEVNSMESTVMMLSTLQGANASYLRSRPTRASNKGAVLCNISVGTDLCSTRAVLNAVKEEIIAGPQPLEDSDAAGMKDGSAKKTAAAYRHHLRSCFDLWFMPSRD